MASSTEQQEYKHLCKILNDNLSYAPDYQNVLECTCMACSTEQQEYKHLWKTLNDNLSYAPDYQNASLPSATDSEIELAEQRLNVKLPDDIKYALRCHNGRKKLSYGLPFRLPTTDLLPLADWYVFETEPGADRATFFECLTDNGSNGSGLLEEDIRDHLAAYRKDQNIKTNNEFKSLPCELLVIGEGMDDYSEKIILGLRTGKIYVEIENIPEWQVVGSTFKDWLKSAVNTCKESKDEIQEMHDDE